MSFRRPPVAPFMDVSTSRPRPIRFAKGQRRTPPRHRRDSWCHRRRRHRRDPRLGHRRASGAAGKVIANVSKVSGDPSTDDAHGHGTHIAGIIAGNSGARSTSRRSTAAASRRMSSSSTCASSGKTALDGRAMSSPASNGSSRTASLQIRAINLSLGHPVTEPSTTDPLCIAVMKATAAGIVVVASAGNAGKMDDGTPILGGISSPGNSPTRSPSGAMNTKGTASRPTHHDDLQLRRPTKFEHAVKPDVVAPEQDGGLLGAQQDQRSPAG